MPSVIHRDIINRKIKKKDKKTASTIKNESEEYKFDKILNWGPVWTNFNYFVTFFMSLFIFIKTKFYIFLYLTILFFLTSSLSLLHHYFDSDYDEYKDKTFAKIFKFMDVFFCNLSTVSIVILLLYYFYQIFKRKKASNIYIILFHFALIMNVAIGFYFFYIAGIYKNRYKKNKNKDALYVYDWYHSFWHVFWWLLFLF